MPIYVHAAGGIHAHGRPIESFRCAPKIQADAHPVALRDLGLALGLALPRLTSRFAQLALVGATHSVIRLAQPLPTTTPLYLATGLGDVARTDALYYQVMPPSSEMASPAQFATSGNNMGAFFVAQHLGLLSTNLTISQEDLSFERALLLAMVGAVDETTLPREFYVRRYPLSANATIGEGSAWMYMNRDSSEAIGEILRVAIFCPPRKFAVPDWAPRIERCLDGICLPQETIHLFPGGRMGEEEMGALLHHLPQCRLLDLRPHTGCFPTAVGVALAATFTEPGSQARVYVHVNRDSTGNTGILAWRTFGDTLGGTFGA
jgi:hypothetical protein